MINFNKFFLFPSALFLMLTSIVFSQGLEIYVSDAANFSTPPWKILRYDENGENPSTFINTNLGWPQDILFLEDQNVVLISNLTTNRITKHNSETGEFIENFATGISGPTRIKIGPDTLLYVLQWSGTGKVKRYKLDGTFVDDFTSVGVPNSIGLDWDVDGNLYVSSYNGDHVRKFDSSGNDMGLFVNSNLAGPTNIWFDETGDLLVSDYDGTAVKRFDSSGNFKSNFLTGLSQSEGVAIFPNGNILIGNGATASVKLFDSSGNFIKDFVPAGSGGLIRPNAVIIRDKSLVSVNESDASLIPNKIILEQNYPNPFNPSTKIKFSIPASDVFNTSRPTLLKIFDILGNEIATLVDEHKQPGNYETIFNASSISRQIASGTYFYKITSGNFSETKKMLLLK